MDLGRQAWALGPTLFVLPGGSRGDAWEASTLPLSHCHSLLPVSQRDLSPGVERKQATVRQCPSQDPHTGLKVQVLSPTIPVGGDKSQMSCFCSWLSQRPSTLS